MSFDRDTLGYLTAGLAILAGATGLGLLLPRGDARGESKGRRLGGLLALVATGYLASKFAHFQASWSDVDFWAIAAVTLVSAIGAVSMRSPVYCAIWFALFLLGVAGLFMLQGAQFLAVATVVVYAGAILVTFLFVLMLAQPRGQAHYDRVSWDAFGAAAAGALLVGALTATLFARDGQGERTWSPKSSVVEDSDPRDLLGDHHMARLGGTLFSRYLVGVEVAGTLLLAALVGAVAIVAHSKPSRAGAMAPGAERFSSEPGKGTFESPSGGFHHG